VEGIGRGLILDSISEFFQKEATKTIKIISLLAGV
jgi:hypothetical protein